MRQRWETGRVEAFSDGVFAIAITLLVLDLNVDPDAFGDLLDGLSDQWPSFVAYVTSFLTIGGVWLQHHALFTSLRFVDSVMMRLNLVLLLVASFLPFPTELAADAITYGRDAERVGIALYGITLLTITALLAVMWRYAAHHDDLHHDGISDRVAREAERRPLWLIAVYLAGTLAGAFFAPRVAAFTFLAIAVVSIASARGDRDVAAADTPSG